MVTFLLLSVNTHTPKICLVQLVVLFGCHFRRDCFIPSCFIGFIPFFFATNIQLLFRKNKKKVITHPHAHYPCYTQQSYNQKNPLHFKKISCLLFFSRLPPRISLLHNSPNFPGSALSSGCFYGKIDASLLSYQQSSKDITGFAFMFEFKYTIDWTTTQPPLIPTKLQSGLAEIQYDRLTGIEVGLTSLIAYIVSRFT